MATDHSDASEIWRPIANFPNYEVSSLGRVRQLGRTFTRQEPRWGSGKTQTINIKPKLLGGWVRNRKGKPMACFVALRRDGETHTHRVHRLVLETFLGAAPEGTEGCHNNGNPQDNSIANLRWDSHKENVQDSVRHGTKTQPPRHAGEAHPAATVTDEQVAKLRGETYRKGLFAQYARQWGISNNSVARLYKRESRA